MIAVDSVNSSINLDFIPTHLTRDSARITCIYNIRGKNIKSLVVRRKTSGMPGAVYNMYHQKCPIHCIYFLLCTYYFVGDKVKGFLAARCCVLKPLIAWSEA